MGLANIHFILLMLIVLDHGGVEAVGRRLPEKLFVFGDSYADTGNLLKIIAPSWQEPYGITFPGKPAGRFSDGRIFTDYIASFLKIRSPIPYVSARFGEKLIPYGMNFAVGGSGVFDTMFFQDNLTVQVDHFSEQIAKGLFIKADLESSIAMISVSGNDYMSYQATGGTMEGLKQFTPRLIDQLKLDLERLHEMGVAKVAVTNLHPIGCTPSITMPVSHARCNRSVNHAVRFHNKLLLDAVRDLNKKAAGSPFVIVNLHHAFLSVIKRETEKFPSMLEPCCAGLGSDNSCGSVAINGTKMYSLCSSRSSSFYWDNVHPTQAGWSAVFESLKHSLEHLRI